MFGALFPERAGVDPNVFTPVYTRLEPARDMLLPEDAPRVRFVLTPPSEETRSLDVEAEALASWIARRRTGTPGELRKIAILMRRSTHFQLFVDALARRGIPAIMPPAGSFLDQPAVVDLTAVLRAVSHTFDRAAQISAARTPFFALTDDEIFGHMFSCERGDGCCPYGRFLATIRRWQRDARHCGVLTLVDRILAETPIEALNDVSSGGSLARAHLERVLELAATFDEETEGSLAEFVDELAARREQFAESEPPITDESADAIRIMTVHGSKGLEFDTVILADLAFSVRSDELTVFATSEPEHLVFSGNLESISAWACRTPDNEELRTVKAGRQKAEEERLFYVAATRAKSELVFVVTEDSKSGSGFMKHLQTIFGKDSLASRLTAAGAPEWRTLPLAGGFGAIDAWFEYAGVDEGGEAIPWISDARAAELVAEREEIVPLEGEPGRDEVIAGTPKVMERDEASRRAAASHNRHAGILLHRVLEIWDGETESIDDLTDTLGREGGVEAGEADLVRRRLHRVADSAVLQRLRGMETVGREITIHYIENGRVREGRIDRLLRDGDRLVVLDYKSGKPDAQRIERDSEQVRRYCELVGRDRGEPVSGLLWYIDLDADEAVDVIS
jgi:ATP-dependent helicase/nuclease subunit A